MREDPRCYHALARIERTAANAETHSSIVGLFRERAASMMKLRLETTALIELFFKVTFSSRRPLLLESLHNPSVHAALKWTRHARNASSRVADLPSISHSNLSWGPGVAEGLSKSTNRSALTPVVSAGLHLRLG